MVLMATRRFNISDRQSHSYEFDIDYDPTNGTSEDFCYSCRFGVMVSDPGIDLAMLERVGIQRDDLGTPASMLSAFQSAAAADPTGLAAMLNEELMGAELEAAAAEIAAIQEEIVLVITALGCRGADDPSGAVLFTRHCASCHGAEGRGDGPAAGALATQPPDLTALRQEVPELMKSIDGSRTLRAHGSAAMPVWGPIFEAELGGEPHARRTTLLRLEQLAEHVRELQRAPR